MIALWKYLTPHVTSCYNCMTFYCGPPLSFTNDWVVSVNVGFNLHVNCVLYESETTTCKNQQMIRIITRHLFLTLIKYPVSFCFLVNELY